MVILEVRSLDETKEKAVAVLHAMAAFILDRTDYMRWTAHFHGRDWDAVDTYASRAAREARDIDRNADRILYEDGRTPVLVIQEYIENIKEHISCAERALRVLDPLNISAAPQCCEGIRDAAFMMQHWLVKLRGCNAPDIPAVNRRRLSIEGWLFIKIETRTHFTNNNRKLRGHNFTKERMMRSIVLDEVLRIRFLADEVFYFAYAVRIWAGKLDTNLAGVFKCAADIDSATLQARLKAMEILYKGDKQRTIEAVQEALDLMRSSVAETTVAALRGLGPPDIIREIRNIGDLIIDAASGMNAALNKICNYFSGGTGQLYSSRGETKTKVVYALHTLVAFILEHTDYIKKTARQHGYDWDAAEIFAARAAREAREIGRNADRILHEDEYRPVVIIQEYITKIKEHVGNIEKELKFLDPLDTGAAQRCCEDIRNAAFTMQQWLGKLFEKGIQRGGYNADSIRQQ